jgi:hypothetical protein
MITNWMLSDFRDADMLVRPVPGANHAAWQIGHVTVAESGIARTLKADAVIELPAGFAARFSKETVAVDDPAQFPTKAALLEQLGKVRGAIVAIVKSMSESDLATPVPGPMAELFPTKGHFIVNLIPMHLTMHIGQIQVIRRKLGKPILL